MSKESEVKVMGLNSMHKNTTLKFNANGMEIAVSLNIEPSMKPYLSPNNVFKGDKHLVYSLRKHIPSRYICANTINMWQETLLNRCMILCREAKIKVKQSEIKKLKSNEQN